MNIKLYLDTEFNGFGGDLISLALSSKEGHDFYEVLSCKYPCTWVQANVIPNLNKSSITQLEFSLKLQEFLKKFKEVTIIADWPEDIKHFCNVLILSPGVSIIHPPINFMLNQNLRVYTQNSKVPHNALEDARAIMSAVELN
jgi:hypothetical protein